MSRCTNEKNYFWMAGLSDTFLLYLELRKLPVLCRSDKYSTLISFLLYLIWFLYWTLLKYLLAMCCKIWIWFNFLLKLLSNYSNIIHQRKCPHPRVLKSLQYPIMSLYLADSISGFFILFTAHYTLLFFFFLYSSHF